MVLLSEDCCGSRASLPPSIFPPSCLNTGPPSGKPTASCAPLLAGDPTPSILKERSRTATAAPASAAATRQSIAAGEAAPAASRLLVLQASLVLLLSADSNRECAYILCRLAASVAPLHCVEELIAHGATASAFSDVDGWTAFHSAAAAGREEMMLRLLELCHEDAAAAAAGNTLLHLIAECAASTRAADAAAKAAALRQPVDGKAKLPGLEGWTPLHIACLRGRQRLARLLLQLGADPTLATGAFNGRSPILRAAATGAVCGILRLDEQRKQTESSGVQQQQQQQQQQHKELIPPCETDSGLLPIHLSCFGAHRSLARLLLQTGSRIDALTEKQRWTPLHFAASSGSAALAADLCRWSGGKAVDGRDEGWPLQRTPLVIACEQQASFGDAVKEEEEPEEAITALHVAVLGGSAEFVAAVLQLFKLHVECFGLGPPSRGPQGDSNAIRRLIFGERDAEAMKRIITGKADTKSGCGNPPAELNAYLKRKALRQSGKARAPPIVLLTEPGGTKGSRWSPVSLAAALAAHATLHEAKQEDHNLQTARRLDVCAALVNFAAAEAPPDVAANASSEEQLQQLFKAIANRLLEQAVLRNFAQVTERILEIGLYDKTHAERALQEAASLGRAEICQLLVNAGAVSAASAHAGRGPFELLAKAMQQQQNHMLLMQQHRILAAAAAAATVSPAAQGGSKAASHAAAAALEAAAFASIKSAATAKREQARPSTVCVPGTSGCSWLILDALFLLTGAEPKQIDLPLMNLGDAEEIKYPVCVCVPPARRLLSAETACGVEAVAVDAKKANAEPHSRLSLPTWRRSVVLIEQQADARSFDKKTHAFAFQVKLNELLRHLCSCCSCCPSSAAGR
ncbi:hypothetical protein Emed_005007 [Eimeria media]